MTTRTQPTAEHYIADSWSDHVLVCSCGWRTADRTKTKARKSWLVHVQEHRDLLAAAKARSDNGR